MTKSQAISEVFITAFRALSRRERVSILESLLTDKEIDEDIADMILTRQRRKERHIPYESVRTELKKSGRL